MSSVVDSFGSKTIFSHPSKEKPIGPVERARMQAAAKYPPGGPQGYQDWRAQMIRKAGEDAAAAEAAKGKGRRKKTRVKKTRGGKKSRRSK